jgi:hypothetical protein
MVNPIGMPSVWHPCCNSGNIFHEATEDFFWRGGGLDKMVYIWYYLKAFICEGEDYEKFHNIGLTVCP